ncbi:MAG: hypothetical protein M0Z55_00675 [Peptococcaceae bacterium]|nr:hypothetical protein [Peptococcaceae bacterium]
MLVIRKSSVQRGMTVRLIPLTRQIKGFPVMQEPRTLYPSDPKLLLRGRGFFGGYR